MITDHSRVLTSLEFLSVFGMYPDVPPPPRSRKAQQDPFIKYRAALRDDIPLHRRNNAPWRIKICEAALHQYAAGVPYMEIIAASGLHFYVFCAILRWYARADFSPKPKKIKLVPPKKKVHKGIEARRLKWIVEDGKNSPLPQARRGKN